MTTWLNRSTGWTSLVRHPWDGSGSEQGNLPDQGRSGIRALLGLPSWQLPRENLENWPLPAHLPGSAAHRQLVGLSSCPPLPHMVAAVPEISRPHAWQQLLQGFPRTLQAAKQQLLPGVSIRRSGYLQAVADQTSSPFKLLWTFVEIERQSTRAMQFQILSWRKHLCIFSLKIWLISAYDSPLLGQMMRKDRKSVV